MNFFEVASLSEDGTETDVFEVCVEAGETIDFVAQLTIDNTSTVHKMKLYKRYSSGDNDIVGSASENSSTEASSQSLFYRETVTVKTQFVFKVDTDEEDISSSVDFQYGVKINNKPYLVNKTEPAHCDPYVAPSAKTVAIMAEEVIAEEAMAEVNECKIF